jgi:hypothetical protein
MCGKAAFPRTCACQGDRIPSSGTLQTKQQLYQIPTRHHESPHLGTYLVGFMRFGEEGPGRSGRELGRHGLDSGLTPPHFWGIWVGLPVLSPIVSCWPFPEGQRAMPLVRGLEIGYDRASKVGHL